VKCMTRYDGTVYYTEDINVIPHDAIGLEWRLDEYHGWCIEYPIVHTIDGAQYTPLTRELWR
jgi:hypothetical protein